MARMSCFTSNLLRTTCFGQGVEQLGIASAGWWRGRRRPARPGRGRGSAPTVRLARLRANHGLSGAVIQSASTGAAVARRRLRRASASPSACGRTVSPVRGCFVTGSPAASTISPRGAGLHADRREERLHAVVVGLAPAVERMMVALGTGDAHAEEHLRQRARRLARLGDDLVEVRRRRPRRAAPRRSAARARTGRTACSPPGCRESSGSSA